MTRWMERSREQPTHRKSESTLQKERSNHPMEQSTRRKEQSTRPGWEWTRRTEWKAPLTHGSSPGWRESARSLAPMTCHDRSRD